MKTWVRILLLVVWALIDFCILIAYMNYFVSVGEGTVTLAHAESFGLAVSFWNLIGLGALVALLIDLIRRTP